MRGPHRDGNLVIQGSSRVFPIQMGACSRLEQVQADLYFSAEPQRKRHMTLRFDGRVTWHERVHSDEHSYSRLLTHFLIQMGASSGLEQVQADLYSTAEPQAKRDMTLRFDGRGTQHQGTT